MILAPESHERLEEFFRAHLRDDTLRLPAVRIYAGTFARRLTQILNIQAITFARTIFIAPRLFRRDERERLSAPARLVVHETAHVLQYQREGFASFLYQYVRDYVRALRGADGHVTERHAVAYRAISFELQAREAEAAYNAWRRYQKAERESDAHGVASRRES